MSSGQRKRPGGALDSRRPQKRMRPTTSTSARAAEAEAIELGESAPEVVLDLPGPSSALAVIDVALGDSDETDEEEAPEERRGLSNGLSGPEVIDLTQDDSDESDAEEVRSLSNGPSGPEVIDLTQDDSDESDAEEVSGLSDGSSDPEVIDITQDDSDESDEAGESSDPEVLLLIYNVSVVTPAEGNQQERGNSRAGSQQQSDIAHPSRDDPDELTSNDVPPGTIRCPICMDFYSEIVQSGRQILSTTCGHVFCNRCLYYCLMNSRFCPTCRADTDGQYHPLYI